CRPLLPTCGLFMGASAGAGERVAATRQSARQKTSPQLLEKFLSLPGNKSAQIDVDIPRRPWRVAHEPDAPLFCGSCFKTFVLTTYLQELEAGRLSESEQLKIDDDIRSVGGDLFEGLTGTAPARSVLEAMVAHT